VTPEWPPTFRRKILPRSALKMRHYDSPKRLYPLRRNYVRSTSILKMVTLCSTETLLSNFILKMEGLCSSETLVSTYQTARCHNREAIMIVVRHKGLYHEYGGRKFLRNIGTHQLEQWYSTFFCSRTPRYNFSSTLYPQSCWCIIQVIHSL
jgi:hypothetical protein